MSDTQELEQLRQEVADLKAKNQQYKSILQAESKAITWLGTVGVWVPYLHGKPLLHLHKRPIHHLINPNPRLRQIPIFRILQCI